MNIENLRTHSAYTARSEYSHNVLRSCYNENYRFTKGPQR